MNNKLFAYNSGLKSRFTEVIFEDFDESELSKLPAQQALPVESADVAPPRVTSLGELYWGCSSPVKDPLFF